MAGKTKIPMGADGHKSDQGTAQRLKCQVLSQCTSAGYKTTSLASWLRQSPWGQLELTLSARPHYLPSRDGCAHTAAGMLQAIEAEAGSCSPPGDAEPDWQLLRERLCQLDVMSRQMQHRLSGSLPASTASGSEGQPPGSQQGAFDSTDRVSLTDSAAMAEAVPEHQDDLERAAAAESDTGPAKVPGRAVNSEDSSAASAQVSAVEQGYSPAPSAGLQALSATAQTTAPFHGSTAAADAPAAGVRAAAAAAAHVPAARPGRPGSIAGDGLAPWTGAPANAASARKAEPEVDPPPQGLGASRWGGAQAAADVLHGGGCSDERSSAQPLGLRQVTLQVSPPVLEALVFLEWTTRGSQDGSCCRKPGTLRSYWRHVASSRVCPATSAWLQLCWKRCGM